MKEDVLTLSVSFLRLRKGLNVDFQEAGDLQNFGEPTPMARYLARAHALEWARGQEGAGALGRIADRWGVTRSRVGQMRELVYLAPDLQTKILVGAAETGRLNFHKLLAISRLPLWADQRKAWAHMVGKALGNTESNPGGKAPSDDTR